MIRYDETLGIFYSVHTETTFEKIEKQIVKAITSVYPITTSDIYFGKRRFQKYVRAKRAFCYFLRKMTELTVQEIGNKINFHYSTVLHHLQIVNNLPSFDTEYYNLKLIERELNDLQKL